MRAVILSALLCFSVPAYAEKATKCEILTFRAVSLIDGMGLLLKTLDDLVYINNKTYYTAKTLDTIDRLMTVIRNEAEGRCGNDATAAGTISILHNRIASYNLYIHSLRGKL